MSKVNRNDPKRSKASDSRTSLMEFERQFPDDATCLDYLVKTLYPKGVYCPTCRATTKHHRDKARPSYACQYCGHHEHPMAGTIFQDSATSLKLWFYAMYLMASTRCGISAKQLEREFGVTYKTAWRMFHLIRNDLMDQDRTPLDGDVEADETFVGGRMRAGDRRKSQVEKLDRYTPVAGVVERGKGGRVIASVTKHRV